ncbi:MAG: TonB-dependent receptor [Xanthomonadales bacterium]|nr:TonB-dependent receptor [Xanthomonadales bacterium]
MSMPVRTTPAVNRLCAALLAALAVPALPAMAQEAASKDPKPSVKTLDQVTVTGSRIKRVEIEQALPITSITKQEIDAQGITSAEQLLMYLNIASNGSDNLASNAGIVQDTLRGDNGVSGANLRGQGSDATLVLLNGRRVATHGLKGRAVDLNSIPFAAIDRVEVLRDGASAIYGTDAIGGVINFITKRDYQGAQVTGFVDVTEEGGGNVYRSSLLFGHGDLDKDGWNAFGTVSVKRNTILRGDDRDFSNSFQPERGLSPDTRGTPFATVFSLGTSGVGATSMLKGGVFEPGNATRLTAVNIYNLPGAEGCEAAGPNMGPYAYRSWNSLSSKYACAWDYPAAAVIQQPVDSVDFIGRATFRIGEQHEAYVELTGSKVKVAKTFEPNQISSSTSTAATALGPTTWYPLNANTKATYDLVYNALAAYFGAGQLNYGAPIAYRWRCMACGSRQIETTTDSYRFVAGIGGMLGDWTYDVGLSRASSKSESILGTGFHYTDALKAALGSGLINPFLAPGQAQSAEAMAALDAASAAGVKLYGGESIVTELDASVSGELGFFQLPGGSIAMAAGIDLRREEYKFDGDQRTDKRAVFNAPFDDANALGDVSRDIKAAYVEFNLPVFKNFDLNLAGRYDDYSGFGSTTNPKVSFRYKPFESLLFRGAYSTGFKVPNFNQLYNGISEVQYTGQDLADPATCPSGKANPSVPGCEIIRPVELFGGNPGLAPEESTQKSFGLVYSPMDRFNIALDWWEIERTNTIRAAARDVLITYYDEFEANWIRDASGEVVAIDRRYINSGGSITRGVELDANFNGELAGGRWNINLNGSYLNLFKTKALETLPYSDNLIGKYVRYYNLPIRWKHTLSFNWTREAWSHTFTQIHRDGYYDEPAASFPSYIPDGWNPRVEGYTTYNYNVTWTGIDRLKLGFGIKNLFNQDPPFTAHQNDFAAGAGWEPRIADPRGRAYTLLVEYDFW